MNSKADGKMHTKKKERMPNTQGEEGYSWQQNDRHTRLPKKGVAKKRGTECGSPRNNVLRPLWEMKTSL